MWLLAPYSQLQAIELAMRAAIVVNDLCLSALHHRPGPHHHCHYICAERASVVLGALVLERGGLGLLVREEARPTVESVNVLSQAVPTQRLRALDTVVELI